MSEIPTGWMSADEARKWARRGVWAYRTPGGGRGTFSAEDAEDVTPHIYNGESWRFLCAHPDDLDAAPAVETVEVEAFVVVSARSDGTEPIGEARDDERAANSYCRDCHDDGYLAHVVRIVSAVPLPTRVEPVTVRGKVKP